VWTSTLDISVIAEPTMKEVWVETGETIALFVPQGNLRLCIAELPSEQLISFRRGVGLHRAPRPRSERPRDPGLHECSFRQARETPYTEGTTMDVIELARELARTKRQGYAVAEANSYRAQ
jgi:DNA-binding IclR family transcriptional regulator